MHSRDFTPSISQFRIYLCISFRFLCVSRSLPISALSSTDDEKLSTYTVPSSSSSDDTTFHHRTFDPPLSQTTLSSNLLLPDPSHHGSRIRYLRRLLFYSVGILPHSPRNRSRRPENDHHESSTSWTTQASPARFVGEDESTRVHAVRLLWVLEWRVG